MCSTLKITNTYGVVVFNFQSLVVNFPSPFHYKFIHLLNYVMLLKLGHLPPTKLMNYFQAKILEKYYCAYHNSDFALNIQV